MLRSSQQPRLQGMRTQSFFPGSPSNARSNPSTPQLRKTRSGSSLGSPGTPIRGSGSIPESCSWRSTEMVDEDKFVMIPTNAKAPKRLTQDGLPMPPPLPGDAFPDEGAAGSRQSKRHSFDLAGMRERAGSLANSSFSSKGSIFTKSKSSKAPGTMTPSTSLLANRTAQSQDTRKRSQSKSDGNPMATVTRKESPLQWANWVAAENTFQMDVGKTKRLRMLLRHESTE
jgi:type IV secretory pathway VirB10-like protein